MNKIKYVIGILLLFMVIGFATVTVTLSINGNAKILSDLDQFKVYFSDVKLNNARDLTLVKSEKELQFYFSFTAIGTTQVISYDVTNASKIFDASLNISCTSGDEYFSVVNVFDTSTNLEALGTRTGTLTMKKIKSISSDSDKDYSVTCTIDATPIERDSEASGDVSEPVERTLKEGDEVSIGDEVFNVISTTDTTVTMLAQKNISDSTPYKQTDTQIWTTFSDASGWEYTPGPKEIDVQTWGGDVKTILNNYVSYLNTEYGVSVTGDLITVSQLGDLGCTVPSDYAYGSGGWTCTGSEHSEWLVNGQSWWTRSADSDESGGMWMVYAGGNPDYGYYYSSSGVRPVITISKKSL